MTLRKSSTCCLNVSSVTWIDGPLELWLLNEIFVYKWNFYVFSREVVLINKINMSLHMIKLLSIQDGVSGWGQSFVCGGGGGGGGGGGVLGGNPFFGPPTPPPPPPIQRIVDHMGMWSYVSFCLATSMWKDVKPFLNFLPWPCPLVLLFGLLCPHLYWAEYFYVANVVKVLFINFSSTQVTWFCLLQYY